MDYALGPARTINPYAVCVYDFLYFFPLVLAFQPTGWYNESITQETSHVA